MSVQKIDYEDKIGLQNDENIPNKNKVTDEDMNEIKETVNNNADELTTAQQNIEDLEQGQGIASGDITSLKNRVTTLETDNETNKTNISTLQEDVEGIESNITELQTEQTAQNKKIQELDDNQIHITTDKSSNINVQDASGQNGKIKLFGISKQETSTQGNNYFDINRANFQKGTINVDGITINTSSDSYYTENYIELEKGKYFLYEEETNDWNKVFIYDNNKSFIRAVNTRETHRQQPLEFELADNEKYIRFHYYTTETANRKIMLSKDSAKDYEEFVPDSPSPKYLSKIENVTGDIDITVCNKNLFDKNKITDNNYLNKNGGLTSNTLYCVSDFINVAENETYFLPTRGTSRTKFYNKNKQALTNTWDVADGDKSFIIPSNAKYIRFSINKETVNVDTFQFERNSIATDYIENEQQLITFPLAQNQKMLEGSETKSDGIHHKRKQIELDGTENWILSDLTTNNQYILTVPDIKIIGENNKGNLISSHFKEITGVEGYNNNNINGISGWSSTQIRISLDISIINRNVAKFKNWLAQQKQAGTPVVVEYPLAEEETEAYTEEQQEAYNQLQNVKTYKTVTNVFTENAELQMEYVAHTKTYIDNKVNNMQNQINTINELLSTTNTSALLLDNLQTDLESEVL